jgi:hypothetical protein
MTASTSSPSFSTRSSSWAAATVAFVILVPILLIYEGFALSYLWLWFITPVFGIRAISLVEAIGICIAIGFMTKQYVPAKDGDNKVLVYLFFKPALNLAIGWLVLKLAY